MATTASTLQNLNVAWGVPDASSIIADLAKQSGILQSAVVGKSSHGNKHRYKYWNTLPGGSFRALGTGIVPSAISKNMAELDLWEYADIMQADAREVMEHPGGKDGWFIDNVGAFLEGAGQAIEKQIIYGTDPTFGSTTGFVGLHQYAKANSKVTQLSGSSSSRNTMFVVRWDLTNGVSLRWGNQSGNLIQVTDLTPVQPTTNVTNTTTGALQPVYQWYISAYFTLVVPTARSVAAITQIDSSHLPTAPQIENAIDSIRSNSGQIVIYVNDVGSQAINALRYGKFASYVGQSNFDYAASEFLGIPVVKDTNLLSTETTALD